MKKFLAMFLALVMVVGLVACGGGNNNPSGGGAQTNTDGQNNTDGNNSGGDDSQQPSGGSGDGEIVVAFIGNTTGDYAQYGIPVRNSVQLYINQLNDKGGINGKQVKVLEYDDKGDGVEAVNAFNLALDNGATAIIGSVLSGPSMALADATYEVNMPQISASATAAGYTMIDADDPNSEIRTNAFRACFIDPFQGEKMADYAVNKLGAQTAGILYEMGVDYSEGLMAAFEEKAGELGLEIVAKEAYATGDKDFKAQITNIAAQNPDIVYAPVYYGEAGLAITQARQAGLTATFVGGDGYGSIKDYASAEDLEGTVYCSGYAPGTESVAQFEADYEAAYGEPVPNMFAPLAYDAAMLMCNALEAAENAGLEAGTDDYKQAVIDALAATNGVEGVTGSYAFDEYNNPIKSAAIIELTGGNEQFKEMY
ncbi:MAG: ABC transporter substrate-binding protein [Oscillospiraceae bacterium]|nr:ABC transporter substrate-binding protein [Oscillospiraceae bacterium]